MFLILLFTILGFVFGLSFVMIRRKITPTKAFTATMAGLLAIAAGKILRDYSKKKKRFF